MSWVTEMEYKFEQFELMSDYLAELEEDGEEDEEENITDALFNLERAPPVH